LRELALRRTAERVDTQMRSYRDEHVAGAPVWQAGNALLAGIGPRGGDDAVVRAAARLAAALNSRWHAVFVDTPALAGLPDSRRRAVFENLKLAQELGAQTATVPASEAAAGLVEYARTHNLGTLVLGRTLSRHRAFRWSDNLASRSRASPPRRGNNARLRANQRRTHGADMSARWRCRQRRRCWPRHCRGRSTSPTS
jgi:two-component system sensor histidine kinase KdpD